MSSKQDEAKKVSRRNLLKGLGAAAVAGAVLVVGVEEGLIKLPALGTATPSKTPSTTPSTTPTMTPTTTASTTPSTTPTTTPTTTASTTSTPVSVALTSDLQSVEIGNAVTFTATPSGGTPPYTISIDCGDGTILTASGPHTYTVAGTYNVLATATDSKGLKGYATVVITAFPPSAV